jgi:hypothetical protein
MTAADDWTKEIMTKGLPELKQLYRMLGVEDLVMAKPLLHFPHNYNYVSRAVMYSWLNKHLKLGFKEPVVEQDFQPLSVAEMTVWSDEHPKPAGGPDYERSLLRWITEDSQKQMQSLIPGDAASWAKYREVVGSAVDVMIGRGLPDAGAVQSAGRHEEDHGDWVLIRQLVQYPAQHEEVPTLVLQPKSWNRRAVVWVDREGKQGLFDETGKPKPAVAKLLAAGVAVVGVDLFGQGEFTADGKPIAKTRFAGDEKKHFDKYAGYTWGYNHPVFAQRVHDLLSVVALLKNEVNVQAIDVVGLNGAGHWVAAARAQAGEAIDRAVVDAGAFRFANVSAFDDPDFLPGGAKYLDLPGILALSAPQKLWLSDDAAPVIRAAYQAAGNAENLSVAQDNAADKTEAAIEWLLR